MKIKNPLSPMPSRPHSVNCHISYIILGDKMQIMLEQGSQQWLDFRRTKIGASEAATILGINPWESAYDLWRRKVGLLEPTKKTEAMQRGLDLEDEASAKFEAITGLDTKPIVLQHKNIPYMIASLDGFNQQTHDFVELKCPNQATHDLAKEGKIPEYYMAQVQHQIEVLGVNEGYYATYRNGEMHIVEVERNQKLIDHILESQEDFYSRMIEFDPPSQKHKVIETPEMINAVYDYIEAYTNKKESEEALIKAKEVLCRLSGEECIQSGKLKVTHYYERGRIDYAAIEEIKNIDLEKYRKSAIKKSRISFA